MHWIGKSAAKPLTSYERLSHMIMRKVQRLAERRRAKRPEMRGSCMRTIRPLAERFAEKVRQCDGCHEWAGAIMKGGPRTTGGYGQINVGGRATYAHRVAWELANGPIPKGAQVLHSCDNRRCVNVAHLRLGSFRDNMDDMLNRLRQPHGPRNGHATLTVKQVRAIREEKGDYLGFQQDLARKYGITQPL